MTIDVITENNKITLSDGYTLDNGFRIRFNNRISLNTQIYKDKVIETCITNEFGDYIKYGYGTHESFLTVKEWLRILDFAKELSNEKSK